MAILRVAFASTYNKENIFNEIGFFKIPPRPCNCDLKPYQHTHDNNYFDWGIEVENYYYIFDEEN